MAWMSRMELDLDYKYKCEIWWMYVLSVNCCTLCEVFNIVSVWFRKHIRLFPSKDEIGEKVHVVELHVWTTYYCLFIPIVRVLGALFGSSKIHYVLPVSKWVPKAHPKYVQRRVHIICKLDFFQSALLGAWLVRNIGREWDGLSWSAACSNSR